MNGDFEIATTCACASHGINTLCLLSKDHDNVFRKESYIATCYFYFRKDGNYREINREHMFIAEMDRGTWKQDITGQNELKSSILVKELKSDVLTINTHDVEKLRALGSLERDIMMFLAADEKKSYTPDEIENAWMYTYTWTLFNFTKTINPVHVDEGIKKVTREQLVRFLGDWRAYLKDDTKNYAKFKSLKPFLKIIS